MNSSSFSGVFSRDGSMSMAAARDALQKEGYQLTEVNSDVVFCERNGKDNVVVTDDGWNICGKAEIYNRDEVCKRLSIPNGRYSDLELVLYAFRKIGEETPRVLNGVFSFAIWNVQDDSLFVARDHVGISPLFYFKSERFFFFSDSIKLLSKFAFARRLNKDKIVQLLQKIYANKEQTIFEEIQSLPAAHYIQVSRHKHVVQNYWKLSESPASSVSTLSEAAEGLLYRLSTAVSSRVDTNTNIGLELSGGLDSSAIAALVSRCADKEKLFAFSNVLPVTHKTSFEGFSDEWNKATAVAKHLAISAHHAVDAIADPISLSENIVSQAGIPYNFYLSFYQSGIYNIASGQKVTSLYSGFGGDEGISMHAGQRYVVSLAREFKLRSLFGHFSNMGLPNSKAVVATAYQVSRYVMKTKQRENRQYLLKRYNHLLFKDELLADSCNREQYLGDDYFKYYSPRERMQFFMTSAGTAARLESGYFISGCYGLSYKYPFLDVPLMEFFYNLPDNLKVSADGDRAVLRKAVERMLPADIVNQPKRPAVASATVPFHRVEREKHFDKVKEHLTGLNQNHSLFDFWDRDKLLGLRLGTHDNYLEGKYYDQLLAGLMLSFFVKNHNSRRFYEI